MLQLKNFYFIIICILIFTDKYIERPLKMFEVLVFFFFLLEHMLKNLWD